MINSELMQSYSSFCRRRCFRGSRSWGWHWASSTLEGWPSTSKLQKQVSKLCCCSSSKMTIIGCFHFDLLLLAKFRMKENKQGSLCSLESCQLWTPIPDGVFSPPSSIVNSVFGCYVWMSAFCLSKLISLVVLIASEEEQHHYTYQHFSVIV